MWYFDPMLWLGAHMTEIKWETGLDFNLRLGEMNEGLNVENYNI